MTDGEIKLDVKVSGKDVFKAVRNYLENSETMKTEIELAFHDIVASGSLQDKAVKQVSELVRNWSTERLIANAVTAIVTEEVRKKIDAEVQVAIKKALSNAVFFKPE